MQLPVSCMLLAVVVDFVLMIPPKSRGLVRMKGFFFFEPLFLFYRQINIKIEGTALYFRRAFIFKPLDFT